jgi:hypothetical protein
MPLQTIKSLISLKISSAVVLIGTGLQNKKIFLNGAFVIISYKAHQIGKLALSAISVLSFTCNEKK